MENSYLHRLDHKGELRHTIDALTYNEFIRKQRIDLPQIQIDAELFRKCVWIASLLASSRNEEDLQATQIFAVLSFLHFSDDKALEKVALLLLARVGNLAASRHLPNFSFITRGDEGPKEEFAYDSLLSYEVATLLEHSTLETADRKIIATQFQKQLWDELRKCKGVSISGPTSSGKSFIIKSYIKSIYEKSPLSRCLYIVPSRALINQVSDDFHADLEGTVEIKTAFLHEAGENLFDKGVLYILTPERCLKIFQQEGEYKFDFAVIFIDEIQNVENETGRGSIMEYIIAELGVHFPTSQFIIAGPNIENVGDVYRHLFTANSTVVSTSASPVFQIKSVVRPQDGSRIEIVLQSTNGGKQRIQFNATVDVARKFKSSIGEGMAALIDLLARDQQNIVYSPKTNLVENWATKFAITRDEADMQVDQEIAELIEFLSDEIHPKYFLIECLKRRVAFHHGKLPDLVRKEIEDAYLNGRIRTLFCTSTLLQGVNLPAQNLFVVSPQKLTDELTPFEFGNLMGRAGRLRDSFYGTIFCIEKSSDDEWASQYYDAPHEKSVHTAVEKSLNKPGSILKESEQSFHDIKQIRDQNTIVFLRQKFLNDRSDFKRYLVSKGLDAAAIEHIEQSTEKILSGILLPVKTLRKNPSIDPILQDMLFKQIEKEGIEQWCVTPNSNFEKRMKSADVPSKFEDKSFYWQLVDIFLRLDDIFKINAETYFVHSISLSIPQMCSYGKNWLDGLTYRDLIQKDIDFYAVHQNPDKRIRRDNINDVNIRINKVIGIYSTVVTFILVKYLKLLNDIVEPQMSEEQKEKYKFHLSLPNSLELGAKEPAIRKLISVGVLRSVAIKVFGQFKQVQGFENLDIVSWLRQQSKLNLKPIYLRYLQKLKLLRLT